MIAYSERVPTLQLRQSFWVIANSYRRFLPTTPLHRSLKTGGPCSRSSRRLVRIRRRFRKSTSTVPKRLDGRTKHCMMRSRSVRCSSSITLGLTARACMICRRRRIKRWANDYRRTATSFRLCGWPSSVHSLARATYGYW